MDEAKYKNFLLINSDFIMFFEIYKIGCFIGLQEKQINRIAHRIYSPLFCKQ